MCGLRYYETSVFFDIEQKPGRLSYYENYIDFLQALIDKQIYMNKKKMKLCYIL